ncbi:MAG TPA: conjugal transfer protein [Solirubrobacteraceae bacterium]|nr:conjugal transfer protein [Solirubrobacteraceae bacterium]
MSYELRSLVRVRAAARAPRVVAVTALAVLSLSGLKGLIATPVPPPAPTTLAAESTGSAATFAESFARAYLTVDPSRAERWSTAVAAFAPTGFGALEQPSRRAMRVRWTAVVDWSRVSPRRVVVTVVADTSVGLLHLAIAVDRSAAGALQVGAAPALVGGPIVNRDARPTVEREVDDEALRAVAGRVVKNYLARERDDLAADLAPGAVVSLPDLRLRVASLDGVTWSGRRVAVAVTARGRGGLRLALRYELVVVRRGGRWLVRTVHTNPVANGGSR